MSKQLALAVLTALILMSATGPALAGVIVFRDPAHRPTKP